LTGRPSVSMIGRELRSIFPAVLRRCRDFCAVARRRAGTDYRGGLHSRAGGHAADRVLTGARKLSRSSVGAVRDGRDVAAGTLFDRDSGQSLVDHSGCRLPTGDGTGPREQMARPGHDAAQLRIPDGHLVMADGRTASPWHMGTSAARRSVDYRRRLEAFFRAGSITDPCVAAVELSIRYATASELLNAHPMIVAEYAGDQIADLLGSVWSLMVHAHEDGLFARQTIRTQNDAGEFLRKLIGSRCDECLVVLFLNAGHGLIDYETIAVGEPDSVQCSSRRILLRAISRGASRIIVAHNHPSGDPRPSKLDILATRDLADAARAMGIVLDDHLVVAAGDVCSAMFAS
jgi:DNA repair protein RadC